MTAAPRRVIGAPGPRRITGGNDVIDVAQKIAGPTIRIRFEIESNTPRETKEGLCRVDIAWGSGHATPIGHAGSDEPGKNLLQLLRLRAEPIRHISPQPLPKCRL